VGSVSAAAAPAFKAFFFAALDQLYPVGPGGQRAGQQPSVATFHYWVTDLAVFAARLDGRGIARLCDVTAAGWNPTGRTCWSWTGWRAARRTCWP
jgi:hypothetical protein